ncbi:MAG: ABC transporter permease [Salinivirgaceae bacterium]|nr:ABC transporter permease [Salinivirgaceae bacterium]
MNLSAFVARRYLFSKKSHNIINVISAISLVGVAVCTMALVIVLSVFNGFDSLIKSMFSNFDPDIKITPAQGKVLEPQSDKIKSVLQLDCIDVSCETLEENVLLEYDKHMNPGIIKGVPEQYRQLTGIDTLVINGTFTLADTHRPMAVVGSGLAYYLSVNVNFVSPIFIYVPKRNGRISMNPERAFIKSYIYPSGVFAVQQEIDTRYMLVPLDFARKVLEYSTQASAIEIKLKSGNDADKIRAEMAQMLGPEYVVRTQYQQHELLYKVMKSEKFAIYLILTFILLIGSFNMIGSLAMLIIDKKDDIKTLSHIGLSKQGIRRIFASEGRLISIGGALAGLLLGFVVCWLQQTYGFLKLDSMGSFVISDYPVKMMWTDFVLVLVTVVGIGLVASWYPIRLFTKRYLSDFPDEAEQ